MQVLKYWEVLQTIDARVLSGDRMRLEPAAGLSRVCV
jgi:hypothetical protein